MGPFEAYAPNADSMIGVMRQHQASVEEVDDTLVPAPLLGAARRVWAEAVALGETSGYRNAQASVLAPTGTIGFLMDCDTTGVEPDLALVKYKNLVGGGMMKIVNTTVPLALATLGYTGAQTADIIEYIDEMDTIEGAPHLLREHLPVFDCAIRPMRGERAIEPLGHLRMMGAVQPFLSGAISKTVNMPNETTTEEIAEAYLEAWRLGLKAVAIYRDGCKRTQPLNLSTEEAPAEVSPAEEAPAERNPERERLPDERQAITHKFSIQGHEGYLTVGLYEDGRPGEIFVVMAKQGSTISGLMDAFATSTSIALQYGVPLRTLCDKFTHTRFEPQGFTRNQDIPIAKSITDYIFRWLGIKFLPREQRTPTPAEMEADGRAADVKPADEGLDSVEAKDVSDDVEAGPDTSDEEQITVAQGVEGLRRAAGALYSREAQEREISRYQADAPPCPVCGAITVRSGACYKCANCGATTGCS